MKIRDPLRVIRLVCEPAIPVHPYKRDRVEPKQARALGEACGLLYDTLRLMARRRGGPDIDEPSFDFAVYLRACRQGVARAMAKSTFDVEWFRNACRYARLALQESDTAPDVSALVGRLGQRRIP